MLGGGNKVISGTCMIPRASGGNWEDLRVNECRVRVGCVCHMCAWGVGTARDTARHVSHVRH